ncbi:MAG: phage Gp37/Gp68 family protein [Rhodocyclaceae bacterium]|nr:phage Gp37/Gp68 family protein [Rhodocyclaceae bacterium]
MSDKSKIEWTDATWNPVTGCTKVSAGCKHCYAERTWARLSANPTTRYHGRAFTDVQCHIDVLHQPLRWTKPRRIFVNSMSDLFHPDVPDRFIADVFGVMAACPQHTFQVLTKRPERMRNLLRAGCMGRFESDVEEAAAMYLDDWVQWPLKNVWLGVSVEDQATADERIPLLLQTPAAVRWVSAEPLLGPVDLNYAFGIPTGAGKGSCPMHLAGVCPEGLRPKGEQHLHWVIVGGESGPKARPMNPDLVRSLRDQCAAAGVPFMFKQWGEWGTCYQRSNGTPVFRQFDTIHQWKNKARTWVSGGICLDKDGCELKRGADFMRADEGGKFPVTIMHRVGKKAGGRLLDGQIHDAYPEVRS